MDWFIGAPSKRPAANLSALADAINAHFGRGSMFFVDEGTERKWKMKQEMLSGCPTTRRTDLLVAKT